MENQNKCSTCGGNAFGDSPMCFYCADYILGGRWKESDGVLTDEIWLQAQKTMSDYESYCEEHTPKKRTPKCPTHKVNLTIYGTSDALMTWICPHCDYSEVTPHKNGHGITW